SDGVYFDKKFISASSGAELPRAEFSNRLAIGRRAIRYLHRGDIVNIGTGIPGDSVGPALAEAGLSDAITLTVESGVYGGVPAGGFIDITQSARLVCFCFSLDGTRQKFVNQVEHLTFSAEQARKNNQDVLYVTERAVFRLDSGGLVLIELAPGLDIKNVLEQIPFPIR